MSTYSDPFGLKPDDVFVNCRPVGGEGDSGVAGHCAVRVVDEKQGLDVTIELIPNREGKDAFSWAPKSSDKVSAYTGDWTQVDVPEGMTSEQFDNAVLRAAFIEMNARKGSLYLPFGQVNSNNFVFEVISRAGGRVPRSASSGFLFVPGICGGSGFSRGQSCTP